MHTFNFGHLSSAHAIIYMTKYEGICGCCQKPKRVRQQRSLRNAEQGLLNDAISSSGDIVSCNILLKNKSVRIRKGAVLLFAVVSTFSERTLGYQRNIAQDCHVMNPGPHRKDAGELSTGAPCSVQPGNYVKTAPR
jgi:predicted DNA binding CopG/RHH family protein